MNNKIKNITLLIITIIFVGISVEIISFLLLRYSKEFQFTYPYFNSEISPYYAFKNSPGFKYINCIKSKLIEQDVVIDEYGFISGSPITKQKGNNTIRVFITGGSGAFGIGQSDPYERIKKYPTGIYSFESSIAGLLQKKLKKTFPNKNIEVINACCSSRLLHHSVAYYLETISEFNPDVVITMDGMNDIAPMCGFSPYIKGSIDFPNFIKLYEITQLNQNKSFFNFINLLNTLKLFNIKHKKSIKYDKNNYFNSLYNNLKYKEYIYYKNYFINGSEKFVQTIRYYNSLCETDNVKFVFCLQPLLYRQKFNKSLSISEKKMQSESFLSKRRGGLNKMFSPRLNEIIFKGSNLILKYFIDDYLSEKINQISFQDGFSYIDFNKEIMSIKANIDLYVDYCHLTIDGNDIVAEILSQKVKTLLSSTL